MQFRFLMVPALLAALALPAVAPSLVSAHPASAHGTQSRWTALQVDGVFGPRTEAAVRAYQKAHGLTVDGIAGPQTLRSLGLTPRRNLFNPTNGADVRALQSALNQHRWAPGTHAAKPSKPAATPKPRATARPTARPTTAPTPEMTPEPRWTPEPTPRETPVSQVTPAPQTSPELIVTGDEPAEAAMPTVVLKGGTWFVPGNAGSTNYDFTFQRPTWTGEASVYMGNWGLGGKLTSFQPIYTAAGVQSAALMYDGLLKYRFDRGFYEAFAGYRGLGSPNYNFATAGLGMDRPLVGEWLRLLGNAQGGSDFRSAYVLDGSLGLGLRAGALGLDIGFRQMLLETGVPNGRIILNGPTAGLHLAF